MRNFTDDRYKIYTNNKNVVVAETTYAGKKVRGVAKTAPEDPFIFEAGKELAIARCNAKVANKKTAHAQDKMKDARDALAAAQKQYMDAFNCMEDIKLNELEAELRLARALSILI